MDMVLRKKQFIFKDQSVELILGDETDIEFDGDFLVNGKQIADILGYVGTTNAIKRHVDDDDRFIIKNADVKTINSESPKQSFRKLNNRGETFINESGIYALIFGSKLKEAKEFKHWVTSKLLPTIRETGGYIGSTVKFIDYHFQEMDDKDKMIILQLFKDKDNQRKLIQEHEETIIKKQETIIEQKPKVEKFDRFLDFKNNKKIGTVAKSLSIGPNKLFKFLRNQNILMDKKGKSDHNVPYQKHITAEHFVVKPIVLNKGKKAKTFETSITLVTKKGMNYIYKKINDANAWEDLK